MVKKISEQEFKDAVKNGTAVVDFFATWCGPCKMLSPVLAEVSEELNGKANFFSVDVDEAPALCTEFGIMSVPSVFIFKDGKKADQMIGFNGKPALVDFINGNL